MAGGRSCLNPGLDRRKLNTAAMQVFFDRFAATLSADEEAVMAMDQTGWHVTDDLITPTNLSLGQVRNYSETAPSSAAW